jgi:RHS repeat-associated protein
MGYGYDTYGRLESVTDPGLGTNGFAAVFGYVPDSDLPFTTTSKVGDATGTPVLTGTRGYDAADRLTSIGYARPGNTVVTSHGYTLDAADCPFALRNDLGSRFACLRSLFATCQCRTRADREDGTAWVYGYNDRDEVTSAVKRLPGEELLAGWQQTFAYDNLGNCFAPLSRDLRLRFANPQPLNAARQCQSTAEGGNAAGANRRQTVYTANSLNQYTGISHPNALDVLGRAPSDVSVTVNEQPVTRQGEFWRAELGGLPNALAAVWQPVQVDAVDPGAGPNGTNLEARRSGHRFVPMASETPYYDFDGNLVADARWNYVWNGENQLIEVTTAAPALAAGVPRERYRYVYDSRSRRIARTVERWDLDAGPSGNWVLEKNERFVYDDWNVVAVVDAAGEVVQRYVWGNDLSGTPQGAGGVGGLLAAKDAASGRSWCYAYDGNGNVSAVVDLADGTKVGRNDYDAFGRTIATWGDEGLAGVNPYRFSTKPLEGTGLYCYGFRYYQPETGRWLGRDPIGEWGGVNLTINSRNGLINCFDYLGLVELELRINRENHGRFAIYGSAILLNNELAGKCGLPLQFRTLELTPNTHSDNVTPEENPLNPWSGRKIDGEGLRLDGFRGGNGWNTSPAAIAGGDQGDPEFPDTLPTLPDSLFPIPEGIENVDFFEAAIRELNLQRPGINVHAGTCARSSKGCVIIGSKFIHTTFPASLRVPGAPKESYIVPGFDLTDSLKTQIRLNAAICCAARITGERVTIKTVINEITPINNESLDQNLSGFLHDGLPRGVRPNQQIASPIGGREANPNPVGAGKKGGLSEFFRKLLGKQGR